jgi:hypothetical protein
MSVGMKCLALLALLAWPLDAAVAAEGSVAAAVSKGRALKASADCACFSLCHPEEVRHFLIRLPIVESESSPWYDYLCAVYNTDSVPLPIDLQGFGAWQFPMAADVYGQLRIPWGQRQCGRDGRSTAPACERAECKRWLNLTAARDAEAAVWEASPLPRSHRGPSELEWPNGSLPKKGFSEAPVPRAFVGATTADGSGSSHVMIRVRIDGDMGPSGYSRRLKLEPFHMYFWPENPSLIRLAHPPAAWTEAGRFYYRGSPEGVLYGVWYTPLLLPFARGTGVYVPTGKGRAFASKGKAKGWAAQLGAANTAPAPALPSALEAAAAWAATAAKAWAAIAAQPTDRDCSTHDETCPVERAVWAAAAAAAAAAAVAILARSPAPGDDSAAAAAAASISAAKAAVAAASAKSVTNLTNSPSTLAIPGSKRNHCAPWQGAPPDLAALARAALPGGRGAAISWIKKYGDSMLAACAREMGYDAILMGSGASSRPELVVTTAECTWPGQASPPAECGAPETSYRTGYFAERPCTCTSGAAQACDGSSKRPEARSVLNCGRAPLCQSRNRTEAS